MEGMYEIIPSDGFQTFIGHKKPVFKGDFTGTQNV